MVDPLPVNCDGTTVQHRHTLDCYLSTNSIEKAPDVIDALSATCVCLYIRICILYRGTNCVATTVVEII